MAGYTKLFGSIISSTIWGAEDHVRLVWITMLALADQFGRVEASVPGLAHQAHVGVDQTRAALSVLEAPDPDSRTPDHEGRRIAKMDGGWRLLNHSKYREKQDEEWQKARKAKNAKDYRDRHRAASPASPKITARHPIADTDTYTEADTSTKTNTLAQFALVPPSNGNGKAKVARFTPGEIESIYQQYPRKTAKERALKAIKKALDNLDDENPVAALRARVIEFANSPAGRKGEFVPYPATWFNDKSYLDDPKEWEK
jgi:hypothetical protein